MKKKLCKLSLISVLVITTFSSSIMAEVGMNMINSLEDKQVINVTICCVHVEVMWINSIINNQVLLHQVLSLWGHHESSV